MARIPTDYLFDFQKAFINDGSRFKLFLASRQIGKSFTLACEAVRDCIINPNASWLVVSSGERQAKEWLHKARNMALLWCSWAQENGLKITYESTAVEIRFSNGSRVLALPSNPDTIRGYSANLILDEFAYHENPEKTWEAIFPTISNPINGNLRCIVASTPNGKNNKFWELYSSKNSFSKYKVTIYDAVESGLGINIDELKASFDNEDAWRQEYECCPVESGSTLISVDLVKRAQQHSDICTREMNPKEMDELGRMIYVGIDIGRKQDITCIWGLEFVNQKLMRTCFIHELRNADFATQKERIRSILACIGVRRCCIDCTGIGSQLAEEMASMFGSKVEQCLFNASFKQDIFIGMQRAFQQGLIGIPSDKSAKDLTTDITAIQKNYSKNGNVSFYAPRSKDGHSDRGTALALALRASGIVDGRGHSLSVGSAERNGFYSGSRFGGFISKYFRGSI